MTDKFELGSGCYECSDCGKQTRETGEGESSCELCLLCYVKSTEGNGLSDCLPSDQKYKLKDESFTDDPWLYMSEASNINEARLMAHEYRQ